MTDVSGKIIKQDGSPVDDETKKAQGPDPADDIRAIAKDIYDGVKVFRKLRNSFVVKIGVTAVVIKVIDVVGKIIMENQRLKADSKKQDDEK